MKFDILCMPIVPGTDEDRVRLRPIGRNRERVQQMYKELVDICVAADKAGFDAFSTTEHHFHSEGFEMSPAPLVLYAHLAGICKNISFAPLGVVLPTWDPIRLAEEIAVLDHLTGGRLFIGLARGYQPRWTQVLGQAYGGNTALMDGSEQDNANRDVFDEFLEVMKKAWTEETFVHDGTHYKVPQPVTGIENWIVADMTERLGAPGEVDENGKVVRTCVVPGPFQTPYPPLWQGFSASEKTVIKCAKEGIVPFLLISKPDDFTKFCRTFQEVAAESGCDRKIGQGIGASRGVIFGESYDEAFELGVQSVGVIWDEYFRRFGFMELFRRDSDDLAKPLDFGGPEGTFRRLVEDGHAYIGKPEQIREQVREVATCHGEGDLEWFNWTFMGQGLLTREEQFKQLNLFTEHILPDYR